MAGKQTICQVILMDHYKISNIRSIKVLRANLPAESKFSNSIITSLSDDWCNHNFQCTAEQKGLIHLLRSHFFSAIGIYSLVMIINIMHVPSLKNKLRIIDQLYTNNNQNHLKLWQSHKKVWRHYINMYDSGNNRKTKFSKTKNKKSTTISNES